MLQFHLLVCDTLLCLPIDLFLTFEDLQYTLYM